MWTKTSSGLFCLLTVCYLLFFHSECAFLNQTGLGMEFVNNTLQIFDYYFYSPDAASVPLVIVPLRVQVSPSASSDVAVTALAQAVAVPLTEANRFGGVVTAQQCSQSGEAAENRRSTHLHHHHHHHSRARTKLYSLKNKIAALPEALLHRQRFPHAGLAEPKWGESSCTH